MLASPPLLHLEQGAQSEEGAQWEEHADAPPSEPDHFLASLQLEQGGKLETGTDGEGMATLDDPELLMQIMEVREAVETAQVWLCFGPCQKCRTSFETPDFLPAAALLRLKAGAADGRRGRKCMRRLRVRRQLYILSMSSLGPGSHASNIRTNRDSADVMSGCIRCDSSFREQAHWKPPTRQRVRTVAAAGVLGRCVDADVNAEHARESLTLPGIGYR